MKLLSRILRALRDHRASAPASAPESRGIADVDPTPLSGMGEAVDPDAIARAHDEIPAQREKLPQR